MNKTIERHSNVAVQLKERWKRDCERQTTKTVGLVKNLDNFMKEEAMEYVAKINETTEIYSVVHLLEQLTLVKVAIKLGGFNHSELIKLVDTLIKDLDISDGENTDKYHENLEFEIASYVEYGKVFD